MYLALGKVGVCYHICRTGAHAHHKIAFPLPLEYGILALGLSFGTGVTGSCRMTQQNILHCYDLFREACVTTGRRLGGEVMLIMLSLCICLGVAGWNVSKLQFQNSQFR